MLDLTENLVGKDWAEAGKFATSALRIQFVSLPVTDSGTESDIMYAFGDDPDSAAYHKPASDVTLVSLALRKAIDRTSFREDAAKDPESTEEAWRREFRYAIQEVLAGFKAERPLLTRKISISEWMRVRMITISGKARDLFYAPMVLAFWACSLTTSCSPPVHDSRAGKSRTRSSAIRIWESPC